MPIKLLRALSLLAICCLSLGCTDQPERPATFPVRGTVTYKGKPVSDATVAFLAPGAPRLAVGTTDAAGNFRLTTFQPDDGAVAGRHVVTVKKLAIAPESSPPPAGDAAGGKVDPAEIEQAMKQTAEDVIKAEHTAAGLPSKYATRQTSDLTFEVKQGENKFEIVLTD